MEGVAQVAGSEEDIEMTSEGEDVVPAESVENVAVEPRVEAPAERALPQEVMVQPSGDVPSRPRVLKTYSKKSTGTVEAGTKGPSGTAELPRPAIPKVTLRVTAPALSDSPSSAGPPVPPSPSPSMGDHSSDGDYLEERPSHIWVNASRSRRKLRMDRQRLDDGAVRVRPVRAADTALVRVTNLSAYARGQAPRFTWGVGVGARASDILFVSVVPRGVRDVVLTCPFFRLTVVVPPAPGKDCLASLWRESTNVSCAIAGRSFVGAQ